MTIGDDKPPIQDDIVPNWPTPYRLRLSRPEAERHRAIAIVARRVQMKTALKPRDLAAFLENEQVVYRHLWHAFDIDCPMRIEDLVISAELHSACRTLDRLHSTIGKAERTHGSSSLTWLYRSTLENLFNEPSPPKLQGSDAADAAIYMGFVEAVVNEARKAHAQGEQMRLRRIIALKVGIERGRMARLVDGVRDRAFVEQPSGSAWVPLTALASAFCRYSAELDDAVLLDFDREP